MSDRLDDKITGFVAELVDDPPPAPDIDLDAARSAPPVASAVPRFRLRDVAVAVAAFVAVVMAVGVVVLIPWRDGIEPQQPATTAPTTTPTAPTTTVPPTTGPATPALLPPLAASELLTTDDLPPHLDWLVFDESTHDGDSIAGWGIFEHGVLAIRCEGGITYSPLDPAPASQDRDVPFVALEDRLFKAMYADTAVFGEALYADSSETVTDAFNMIEAGTIDCLGSEITGWSNGGESSRLALPPVGDDATAISVKSYLNNSKTRYDLFRLAIIRDGTRLLIVEEHESVLSQHDPPQVSDAEFIAVVETAVARLETTASTTVSSDPLAMELLTVEDLRGMSSGWEVVPIDDGFSDRETNVGLTVMFCTDPTRMVNEFPWKLTATSPLIELNDEPVAAVFRKGSSRTTEVLYGGYEPDVDAAFDGLVDGLETCLEGFDPTWLIVHEYVEDGWHWVADRYEMPEVGDESYAIRYWFEDGEGPTNSWSSSWRLAVVRSGDRIMAITTDQYTFSNPVNDAEFDEIVQAAVAQLSP